LGADVFERVRKEIPLDLIGMGSEELNGLGEIPHHKRWNYLLHLMKFIKIKKPST
jgi:hypothetical protein